MSLNAHTERVVLLLNLGGPETQADVRPFLFRLFNDPDILPIRFAPLRRFVAWLISTGREKTSQTMYARIGGGSPIRRLTEEQASALEAVLRHTSAGDASSLHVKTAFTCSSPFVEDVVRELSSSVKKNILCLPLYPQYSLTTTKGALERTRAAVEKYHSQTTWAEVGSFETHPQFLAAHAALVRQAVRLFSSADGVHLLFSAHSIPQKNIDELGDPYESHIRASVQGILKELHWEGPWGLSWQSKLGPIKWLSPGTLETVQKLGQEGTKKILVVPVAFVTDHIETLYEIDQLIAAEAKAAGVLEFHRTPGLNSHPLFIECLADLVRKTPLFWAG